MSDLFAATYARGGTPRLVDGASWLRALLEVEAALALACAAEDLIPAEAAELIASVCAAGVESFDLEAVAVEAGDHATPVVPLVRELRARVDAAGGVTGYGRYVHLGATSQDIVDTAMMLICRDALGTALDDARGCAAACANLAERHRMTVMPGRTLLQQALPVSFGVVAAGWLTAVHSAALELQGVIERVLAVQMGGPVGIRGPQIAARVAAELSLAQPTMPWPTDRTRIAVIGSTAAVLCGALAKIARDVTLLAQSEVGELAEGAAGRGGSSAMAHKHNPVAAVSVLACTRRVPGLVATLLAGMEQELQRAAGAWQAEWGVLTELLTLTGSAAAWGRDLLENLVVDEQRMRANLETMAAAGVAAAAEPELHLAGAGELINRALGVYRK